MRTALLAISTVCLGLADASADGVANELSAGSTLGSRSSWIANRLGATWDVDDALQLKADATLTRSSAAGEDATSAIAAALSVDYSASEHWTLSLSGSWSPASTTYTPTELATVETEEEIAFADAILGATSTSTSLALAVGYDSAGDSDGETSASLTLGVDHYQSQQAFSSIVDADGQMLTTEYVRTYCESHACTDDLVAALSPLWTQLTQFSINAGVVRTEYRDIDLGLDATYYFYDKDPTSTGYYLVPGRTTAGGALGNGIGVAPMRYAISPSVGSRWGKWSCTVGAAYGSLAGDGGYEVGTTLKLQRKLALASGSRMKVSARIGSSWSVDEDAMLSTSISMALGGSYTW